MSNTNIDLLVKQLAARDPLAHESGTPVLDRGAPEFAQLLAGGAALVPELTALLPNASAREAAWIVATLAEIGGDDALRAVRDASRHWQSVSPADEWVYAVRGQCNIALKDGAQP